MRRLHPWHPGTALGLCAVLFLCTGSSAYSSGERQGWPQFRGPTADGVSRESGWSIEGKYQPLWETNVGWGYSAVSIQNGRLYTMGHFAERQEDVVVCLDAGTGEEIWALPFSAKTWDHSHQGGTLSTPSVDGGLVFAFNREAKLLCLDATTGEVRWRRDLDDDFDLAYGHYGFSGSPRVFEDMVVLNLGIVAAFDKQGELLWRTERNYGLAQSTPVEVVIEGSSLLAVFNSEGLAVLDRSTGEELGFVEWTASQILNTATPVVVDQCVFISSSHDRRGCALIDLASGLPESIWESRVMRGRVNGCALWEEHLYGFDVSTLKCVGLDGEERWAQRGLGQGCLIVADGKILALNEEGELIIAEAAPDGYRELARKKVLDGGLYHTTPVLLDGLVYCRNSNGDLVCLDHRGADD